MSGVVYLIGAGPGAPDLLTLRAAKLLEKANIVFHDALVHPETIALAARAEKIAVGKRCGKHSTAQKFINKRLIDAAKAHAVVVRLKGGDPMLFGRAQEEIAALEAGGVRYEVVPGVTAALAARSGITDIRFVPMSALEGDMVVVAADAAAIYMGAGHAEAIAAALIAAGKPPTTPIAIVESASLAESHRVFTTLALLPRLASQFSGPAVILIGPQYRARAQSVLNSAMEEDSALTPHRRAISNTD
ncbi:MAG: uroporphyrinogen-III C-methyltransferase [Betaproteobacteria bacterium]|nr:MAG: uroporphyrinogen-III C-methyltransferase [Betaproteobacteria bacterium]